VDRLSPRDLGITAIAITKGNAAASRIAAGTGIAGTTSSDGMNAVQVHTMNFRGASVFRPNTTTGSMWSMTGAATV